MPVLRIQAWKCCEGATFRIPNAAVDFKKIEEMNTGTRVGVKKIDKFFIFYLNFNHDGSTVNFFTGATSMFFYRYVCGTDPLSPILAPPIFQLQTRSTTFTATNPLQP